MKKLVLIFLSLHTIVSYGQIYYPYNGLRAGDEIIKQQVEFKDPGRDGDNVVWDFSKLKSINDEYIISYTEPHMITDNIYVLGKDTVQAEDVSSNELIIGTEHSTMYYYRIKDNKLWLLGHENPTTLLHYTKPLLTNIYPTNFKDISNDIYLSEGLYSSRIPFRTEGKVQIEADAYGMLLLPGGDTLNHVLRIKTIQSIEDGKSVPTILETYKWYSKGYRYPVFETVRTYQTVETEQANKFETAFYFPPQDHFYLDDDRGNLALLDSLWNIAQKGIEDIINPIKPTNKQPLVYNFYPNPLEADLHIEYLLDVPSEITITLYSLDGRLIKTIKEPKQSQGLFHKAIDFSDLSKGTYILNIKTNHNTITSNKIIKK